MIMMMKVIDTSTKVLGMVVSIFLILLILVCLTACLCYCCHQVPFHQLILTLIRMLETKIMIVLSPGLQRQDQECVRANQLRRGSGQQGCSWNEQGR